MNVFTKKISVIMALSLFGFSGGSAFAALPSWASALAPKHVAQPAQAPVVQPVQAPVLQSAQALAPAGASSLTATPLSSPPPNWPWRGIVFSGGTTAELADMATRGANAVSLALNVRTDAKMNHISVDAAWNKELAWADAMLDECKKDKMVGIVTLVGFPLDPSLGLTQESPGFWNNPQLLQGVVTRVGMLAQHFASRGAELGAYDILNEPLNRSTASGIPAEWPALRVAIVKEIRKYDNTHYVVVTPGPGGLASAYAKFAALDSSSYPGIIYSAHVYGPMSYSHQGLYGIPKGESYPGSTVSKSIMVGNLQALVNFQKKYNAYIYIGESGVVNWAPGSLHFLNDIISIFEANHFSWVNYGQSWYGWNPSYDDRPLNNTLHNEKASQAEAASHYVGGNSPRWQLLKDAWALNPKN